MKYDIAVALGRETGSVRINSVRVRNYGSYSDSGEVELGSGINLIIGENNSGKSGLIRCLGETFEQNPHRSIREFRAERLGRSIQEIDLSFSGFEFEGAWLRWGGSLYWQYEKGMFSSQQAEIESFLKSKSNKTKLSRFGGESFRSGIFKEKQLSSSSIFSPMKIVDGSIKLENSMSTSGAHEIHAVFSEMWRTNLFVFDAQRFGLGRSGTQYADRLEPRASNLAAFLFRMQGQRPAPFAKLVAHMREIFSTVGNVTVSPIPGSNELEIRIWPTDEQGDPALSFPLDASGTGISQAIAILAVAISYQEAVIIIDEIGSFLHPSAVKSLIRILQTNYSDHQYIISTHSAEVLSSSSASKAYLVRKDGFESVIKEVNIENLDDLGIIVSQLGISMTDVFASERVIWVEGKTEELCFPYILRLFGNGSVPYSTLFAPVVATGDFGKPARRSLILEIYERLSRAAAPLVKSVTFGFDSEDLSESEKADLTKQSGGRLRFLPRRNFECYIIDPPAIAKFISLHFPDKDHGVVEREVSEVIQRIGGEKRFLAHDQWSGDIRDSKWLAKVDGAKLIKAVVSEISEGRLEFGKALHSLEILKYLVEEDVSKVSELAKYVGSLVEIAQKSDVS